MVNLTKWEEACGGTPEAEAKTFRQLSEDMLLVQKRAQARSGKDGVLRVGRALHAKPLLAVRNARLTVRDDLPENFVQEHFEPGRQFDATVRISNASSVHQSDIERDLRGLALRLDLGDSCQDLLLTNHAVNHARDAKQFVQFALAMSRGRLLGFLRLPFFVGLLQAGRMLSNISRATGQPVASLATESFWSRGAMLWGTAGPVRIILRPVEDAVAGPVPAAGDPAYLSHEIAKQLSKRDVSWELAVQTFIDHDKTPIEDASKKWPDGPGSWIPIAILTVPKQDVTSSAAQAAAAEVEAMAFNPWHTLEAFRPLGNINRARKAVYEAAAAHRRRERFVTPKPLRNRVVSGVLAPVFGVVNRVRPWHRLPLVAGLLNLSVERNRLRKRNLIDMTPQEDVPTATQPTAPIPEENRARRSFDGRYNDLSDPEMGKGSDRAETDPTDGAPFGRNLKPVFLRDQEATPNAAEVAKTLLHRTSFQPAGIVNVLAAAWIQFQVHDWVEHRRYPLGERDIRVKLPAGWPWSNRPDGAQEDEMRIAGDRELGGRHGTGIFGNQVSHWWDASGIYGHNEAEAAALRDGTGPRLRLDHVDGKGGYLPMDDTGKELTGFTESWWLGLSAFHTLFAREHNTVATELQRAHGDWSDDRVYHTTRLVVSALIAKIHTVEWTPAIIARKDIDIALRANWSGPDNAWVRAGIWLKDEHALKGIPDTLPDHHGTPFSLTEDFVTVYRMHQLLPDDYRMHDARTGDLKEQCVFDQLHGTKTGHVMRQLGLEDVFYSLGIAHPGRIALHNYPLALTDFTRPGVDTKPERIDLSVVDIMRERTRGIPRYNAFRTGVHKRPVRRWEDITTNPEDVRLLKDLYGSIDRVDTVVGLTAEEAPEGFGFSDTAFRIFIMMATRRLQSDRFLTVDFRPEIYSHLGIDWVQKTTMADVIRRHMPDLADLLPTGESAFAPWRRRAD